MTRDQGKLVVYGTVDDDNARPIPRALVSATLSHASDPLLRAPLSPISAEPCSSPSLDISLDVDRTGSPLVTTDDFGRFCIRVALAPDRYIAHFVAHGSGLLDGSATELTLDLTRTLVTLRFDPEPAVLSLDDETTSVDVLAWIDGEMDAPARDLVLSLSSENGFPLGNATTDASGRARFVVTADRLRAAGRGELRAEFAGNARAGPATRAIGVERRTRVDVIAPSAKAGRLPSGSLDEEVVLHLVAAPRCVPHACEATPSGMIEAYGRGNTILGAAPLEGAHALLTIRLTTLADAFPTENAREMQLTFRYVPNMPWFRPGGELTLMQPIGGSGAWSRAPLFLVSATAVIALLALGRLSPRRDAMRPQDSSTPTLPVAEIQLVRMAPVSEGWAGHVSDAHDRRAIARARVAIERPSFAASGVVAETLSDDDGSFALPSVTVRPGDELVASGREHAAVRRPLPPPGELMVALVLRKRALLDRLVGWARRRGPPFHALPDATPEHVRRAAGSNLRVAQWATAVERAAYGGGPIDEGTQADVDDLAPGDADAVDGARPRSL